MVRIPRVVATTLPLLVLATGCPGKPQGNQSGAVASEASVQLSNEQIRQHEFLQCMSSDQYYPRHLVDKGKQILLRLCERIEQVNPADNAALYKLTHSATEEFNQLGEEFVEAESELETVARECIASDFVFVAKAYGFANADVEELVATRDW
jgi:tricorn protease-like protein